MKRAFILAMAIALTVSATASAGNWSVFTRYLHPGPTYGCNPHSGLQDCMMPWQPIRSTMHYNVLPPGMLRPLPLHRPTPWLAPHTPDFTAAGFRAAGQYSYGIPCNNPYAACPAGCSYYCAHDWWQLGRFESFPGIYANHQWLHHGSHGLHHGAPGNCGCAPSTVAPATSSSATSAPANQATPSATPVSTKQGKTAVKTAKKPRKSILQLPESLR